MGRDEMMEAIIRAVEQGRHHGAEAGRTALLELWEWVGSEGEPLHRCVLAHYLADLYDDPTQALPWDLRALEAADAVTQERVQQYHDGLQIAGFYPSLHLNLADTYRRLGSFTEAAEHITAAQELSAHLPQDPYGNLIRTAVAEVVQAIDRHDSAPRRSAPSPRDAP